jgi:hypothetical protein
MDDTEYCNLLNTQHKFFYDTKDYNFDVLIKKIFDGWDKPLELLHEYTTDEIEQLTIDNDTSTLFHKRYYNSPYYSEFIALYHKFIKEIVLPQIKCDDTKFIVQSEPSFRINIPNNTAIGVRYNSDEESEMIGLHCDGEYGHPPSELNFMLTFTNQYGSNSCYVETAPMNNQFVPFEMKYGEFISFYGNKCRHFNKKNDTGITRVSIDFRVIPYSKYDPDCNTHSLHSKRKFVIGGYYTVMECSNHLK